MTCVRDEFYNKYCVNEVFILKINETIIKLDLVRFSEELQQRCVLIHSIQPLTNLL